MQSTASNHSKNDPYERATSCRLFECGRTPFFHALRTTFTKIRNAVKEAFRADSVLLTLFGGKPLGGDSYTRVLDENTIDEPITLTLRAKHDWAIYRVDGRLQFQRP